jgi:very-short-patch-repair endonuclease
VSDTTLKQRARELRTDLTEAEQALWRHLRRRNIGGLRFLRQRAIGVFILDFYAPALKLAIEVDGGQHFDEPGLSYDARREASLRRRGITVLRFTNLEVLRQRNAVLEEIERTARQLRGIPPALRADPRTPPPDHSPPPFPRKRPEGCGAKIAGGEWSGDPLRSEGGKE